MMLTTHLAGAALMALGASYAVRAHLLGRSSPGWPTAPWWVRGGHWSAAAVAGAQGMLLAVYAAEPVGPGVMTVCAVLAVSSVASAVNLARQRGRGAEHPHIAKPGRGIVDLGAVRKAVAAAARRPDRRS